MDMLQTDEGRRIIHVGAVRILPNEGGFCGDSIEIGGVDVAELIAKLFDVKQTSRGSYAAEVAGQSNRHKVRELPEVWIAIHAMGQHRQG